MDKVICLFMVLIFLGCAPGVIKQGSKEIEAKTRTAKAKKGTMSFHDVRMKFFNQNRLAATRFQNFDTLFVLDEYTTEDATYHSCIWNKQSHLNYQYQYGKFAEDSLSVFTKYMCLLVQNWDTLEIRNQEAKYSNMIPVYGVYASRVIRKDNKFNVDVVKFKSFFKLDRDKIDQ